VHNEKLTEFYILGINGNATDYPTDFTLENGRVTNVQYGNTGIPLQENCGIVILNIVNYEKQQSSYKVVMQINGTQVDISFNGQSVPSIGPIELAPHGKWEQQIGIAPTKAGSDQEVELFLYKDAGAEAYLNLHLWINVTQR
jgi:uncharacterized membrane protein